MREERERESENRRGEAPKQEEGREVLSEDGVLFEGRKKEAEKIN